MNLFSLYYYYRKLNRQSDFLEIVEESFVSKVETESTPKVVPNPKRKPGDTEYPLSYYKDLILRETKPEVYNFIEQYIDPEYNHTLTVATTTSFNIDIIHNDYYRHIINLYQINDIKRVNRFFEAVNQKLPVGGIYINCVETNEIKKRKIFRRLPPVISHLYYFFFFIFRRVFPKMPFTKKFYFLMTNGFDRAFSKAETYGRLYSCGFEVIGEHQTAELLFFAARKTKAPEFDYNPTYGPVISLKRLGKNGKIIYVYKLRTMFPYAEYLQEYIYKKNSLEEGGKFKDDFRVSTAGRICRKFWLDELPMIFNLLRGDLKLVGVRPLSRHYFSLYSKELQQLRSKHRPGLVPPYYADMPKTLEEIMASEIRYLNAYEKHAFATDWRYFWKAVYNIVIRRERSN
jgi:lipopolysaccharide/colanic/teichoic acid biosynthesis glycosyltransferase